MNFYKSDYPNQVQQLNVSISQNYCLLKDGTIKYQMKKFDINWNNYSKTGKTHLVNFVIRDHFSGCFYGEIHPIFEIPKLSDFLYNAWKQKANFLFCGIPKTLMIPKITLERFPEIITFDERFDGINLQLPSSGFESGIRSVRDWENAFRYCFYLYKDFSELQSKTEEICHVINSRDTRGFGSNLSKWANNKPYIMLPNTKEVFEKYFK